MSNKYENLGHFPILDGLSLEQLYEVANIVRIATFKAGEAITREGEVGNEMFLLLSGRVEVSKSLTLKIGRGGSDTREKSLISLRAADAPYFGEMALLNENNCRSATVMAVDECRVGIITRTDFTKLCESDTGLGYRLLLNIAKTLVTHLEKTNQDVLKLTTAFSLALQR